MIFVNCWGHLGGPRVTFSDSVLKRGSKGPPEQKRYPFPVRSGSQGHFLVHFGAFSSFKNEMFKLCFYILCQTLKKQ